VLPPHPYCRRSLELRRTDHEVRDRDRPDLTSDSASCCYLVLNAWAWWRYVFARERYHCVPDLRDLGGALARNVMSCISDGEIALRRVAVS
jgi:hypothetical protein